MLLPGKSMEFADYLSRHPTGKTSPLDSRDEKFVINIFLQIQLSLLKD